MTPFTQMFRTGIPADYLIASLVIMSIAILLVLLSPKIGKKWKIVLWALLIEYLFVVICSTIIFRPSLQPHVFSRIQPMPFWTYDAVMTHVPGVNIWDIILNVVLFLPLGFLVTVIYPKTSLWKILASGLVLSLTIEISQYFFSKGITQFDDIMHNLIGCLIGYVLSKITICKIKRLQYESR